MLDIIIAATGGVKDKNLASLIAEYEKRLRPFARLKIVEAKASPFRGSGDEEKAKKEEGERLLKIIEANEGRSVFALEERGKEYDSPSFARFLETKTPLLFLIGGALGLSSDVQKRAAGSVSLSQMTYPHELARLMLAEQIYRSAAILSGKKYHY